MVVAKRWRGMRWTRRCRHVLYARGRAALKPFEALAQKGGRVRRSRVVLTPGLLASSPWEANASRGRWCQEAPIHQGEHDIGRKTIAQGRPECFR
jgi:hypothetical protein